MNIVKIWGGLGNQMFQYAFYLMLKTYSNVATKIDLSWYNQNNCHNGFELDTVFGINTFNIATENESFRVGYKNEVYRTSNFIRRWQFRKYGRKKFFCKDKASEAITYYPEVLSLKDNYIQGYWQSEHYFRDISNFIKETFNFSDLDKNNCAIAKKISESNSVSVHVRLGDYLKPENAIFTNLSEGNYYKNAIEYIKERVESPKFFVFSNDIEWCRNNLGLEDACFVYWNKGKDSFRDMQLMSLCKHNIIANSSFSWWGAWLNDNPDKIVLVPTKWFNFTDGYIGDIYLEDWIKIDII